MHQAPFFLNILKRNKHSHPLIYMRGVYLLKSKMPLSKYLSIAGITSDSHLIWWPYRRWFPPSRHFGLSALITWDSYLELPIVVKLGWTQSQTRTHSSHLIPLTHLTPMGRLDSDSGLESSLCPQLSRPPLQTSARQRQSSCPEDPHLPAYRLGCCMLLVSLHLPEEAFSSFPGRQLVCDSDDGGTMVTSGWLLESNLHLTAKS